MLDIEYEFAFYSLSSSNRDEDLNSDLDKFESFLRKDDSALLLQHKVACRASMENIEAMYGPFSDEEVAFYYRELADGDTIPMNALQQLLVFNLFYKYFGDPSTIRMINSTQYVKLIIAAKRILENSGMVLLPHIISSRVAHLSIRKNLNKKELIKLETSMTYQQVKDKYRSERIEKNVQALIATVISSEFDAIEPGEPDLNGRRIQVLPDLIMEEIPLYVLMT